MNNIGITRERGTMKCFDRLPRSVRLAVANANFDWALRGWLNDFNSGRVSAPSLVKRIQLADRTYAATTRRKVWGSHYPRRATQ